MKKKPKSRSRLTKVVVVIHHRMINPLASSRMGINRMMMMVLIMVVTAKMTTPTKRMKARTEMKTTQTGLK